MKNIRGRKNPVTHSLRNSIILICQNDHILFQNWSQPPRRREARQGNRTRSCSQLTAADQKQLIAADKKQLIAADKKQLTAADKKQLTAADRKQRIAADKKQLTPGDDEQQLLKTADTHR